MTLAARARSRPFLAGLVCGGAHAACYALMFPPAFLWGLAFVALAPLMWLAWALGDQKWQSDKSQIANEERHATRRMMRRALLGVFLAAMPMWAWHHLWIWKVTNAGFPVLIVYLSIYEPLFVWLGARWRRWVERKACHRLPLEVGAAGVGTAGEAHRLRKAEVGGTAWLFWLGLPVIWVGLEMLRGAIVWDGYEWYFVGHPTINNSACALIARLTGATGTSLVVADINAIAVSSAVAWWGLTPAQRRGPGAKIFIALHLIVIAALVVTSVIPKPQWGASATHATIAVVQTNVPQDNKVAWRFEQRRAGFERFKAMTRDLARPVAVNGVAQRPDVIAWPETMFPGLALNEEAVRVERGAGLVFGGAPGNSPGGAPGGTGAPSTVFRDELLALQQEVGIPMVVGAIAKDGLRIDSIEEADGRRHVEIDAAATFNSAFVIAGGAVLPERYDKVKLTPFGEYMPYISWSKWLEGKLLALGAGGMRFDLEAGRAYRALEVPGSSEGAGAASTPPLSSRPAGGPTSSPLAGRGVSEPRSALRVATPICFEATAAGVCRRLVFEGGWSARRKADVILNLTNDGWFADSPGAHENHLLLARWRCVELGTPMVRAANTGVSCSIDASGRVTQRLEKRTEGVLRAVVALPPPGSSPTIYARTGDVAGWVCLALTGLMTGATLVNGGAGRRRKGKGDSAADGHESPTGAEGAKR